ncbi:MAG: hypothetical protein E7159_03290 [Firmicutes bacterium]|nr:hypothetical protein [Bacillota bacterium]
MRRGLFTIIFPIIIVIGLIFSFGIINNKNSYSNFVEDGYVISSSDNKYYFSSNNKYKINSSKGNVELDDNNSEKINVDESSFVHYVNGSISTFKKTVVLDLDKLNEESYHYYNFFPESILSKTSNGYVVSYLDNNLTMKNFLLKISENKYMVVSDNLVINIADTKKEIKDNYLEITYLDGNIIKLDNQELSIKNISSSLVLQIGEHVSLDLINKKVLFDKEDKVNLSEITINSDDNIDIVSEDKNQVIVEEEKEEQKRQLPKFDEVQDGLVEVENELIEQIVDENATIKDPEFLIQEMSVTANSIKAFIQVNDNEGILSGSRIIKIIESDTNNTVYYVQEDSGKVNINIDYEQLKPDTNYTLVVNQDYIKNDVTYNRDFIQKAFVSKALGINVSKNYAKSNELSFKVDVSDDSLITKVSYKLFDKSSYLIQNGDAPVKEGDLSLKDDNVLVFDELTNDKVYTLVVSDFVYENVVLQNGEKLVSELKTLKKKPTIDKTTFSVDKLNSKFVIYLNNIVDDDNGIISYHADIYDGEKLVLSKDSSYNDKIEVSVDDNIIQRYTDYKVYVYLTFNDNEKEYEIPIGNEIVNMNSKKGPVILDFEEEDITFERIKGNIVIEDEESLIDYSKNITLTYRSLSIGTGVKISNDYTINQLSDKKSVLNVDVNNLRSNESYLFVISAYIDYKDGNGYVYSDIGSVIVNTKEPNKMTVVYENVATSSDIFRVKARLLSLNDFENTELEASTMEQVSIRLHKSDNYRCSDILSENYNCWTNTKYDGNKEYYESDLKTSLYDNYFEITPQSLNINEDQLTYGLYKIEVFNAKDYTTDKNDLPIVAEEFPVIANNVAGRYIDKNGPYVISQLHNNGRDKNLNNNTIVGYRITPNVLLGDNDSSYTITYHVYNANNDQEIYSKDSSDSSAVDLFFGDDGNNNYMRGKSYYFNYTIKVKTTDENGNPVEISETCAKSNIYYPKRQEPEFNLYLAKRDRYDTLTWNYTLKDVDNSLDNNTINYYAGSFETANNKRSVELEQTDTEKSFETRDISGTVLSMYRMVNLNDDLEIRKVYDVENMYFETRTNIEYFKYSVEPDQNSLKINVSVDDKYKKYLILGDVTFTASNGKKVTVSNVSVNGKGIMSIDYYRIKQLMGLGDITTSVKLYYDNGMIDVYDNNGLKTLASTSNLYFFDTNIGHYCTYELNSFDSNNKNLSIQFNGNVFTYPFEFNKGYLTSDKVLFNDKQADFLVKNVSSIDGTCGDQNGCKFSFDQINPTFVLWRTDAGLTYANIKPEISSVDEEIENDINVKIYVYTKENDSLYKTYEVSLVDIMNNGYTMLDLQSNTDYYFYVKWVYAGEEHDFYYQNNLNMFKFKTLDGIDISNLEVVYVPVRNERRSIRISYDVKVLDGYEGIEYHVLDSSGNDISDRFNISDTMLDSIVDGKGHVDKNVDISYNMNTNDEYIIKIVPYYTSNGEKGYLTDAQIPFHLVITKPLIDVIKITSDNTEELKFRVLVTDAYNALFEHSNYKVYIKDKNKTYDSDYGELIGDYYRTNTIYTLTKTCESKQCQINVVYEANLNNSNDEYGQFVYSKNLVISDDAYLGDAIAVNTDTSKVRYAFQEYWNINKISFMKYTITKKTGEHYLSGDINPISFVIDSDTNHAYVTIVDANGRDILLPTGEYIVQMQFYWLDGTSSKYKVIDKTVDYIKK